MNKIIPQLTVSNLKESLYFYTKILGFTITETPTDRKIVVELNKSRLLLHQTDMSWGTTKLTYPYGVGINFQFLVKDLSPIYKNLKQNNYPLYDEYFTDAYSQTPTLSNDQQIVVLDPDGYLLTLVLEQ